MKVFIKVISAIFFVIFFIIFLLVSTIKFEVLNKSFVFSSFQRNGIYEKLSGELSQSFLNNRNMKPDEKAVYSKMISQIKPSRAQKLIEQNLSRVFDFLNGNSKDITLSVNGSDLGIDGININWSLNRNLDQGNAGFLQMFNGIGRVLFYSWLTLLILLLLFFIKAGKLAILISGIFTFLLGVAGKIFFGVIVTNAPMHDPAQVLLVLLSGSVLSDVAISWIIFGVVFVGLWLILRLKNKFS